MAEQPNLTAHNNRARTVTGWTILFMVLLRIAIGWHFFYEGAWKLKQDGWQATSYLVVAQGPLRDIFRGATPLPIIGPLVEDTDGLIALSPEGAKARIDKRHAQLVKHYGLTDEAVLKRISEFKESRKGAAEDDAEFAAVVANASAKLADAVYNDFAAAMQTRAAAQTQPAEAFDDAQAKAHIEAALVRRVQGFKPRSTATPDNKSEVAAAVFTFLDDREYQPTLELRKANFTGDIRNFKLGFVESIVADEDFRQQLDDYKAMMAQVEANEAQVGTMGYEGERLMDRYARKAKAKSALLSRIEKPMTDMDNLVLAQIQSSYLEATAAGKPEADVIQGQLAKSLPRHRSPTWWIDWANMLALTGVGIGLMLGLFTRLSALGGVGLLMLYYWCMPSLPWLPEAGPQEGHYFFINKNIIEALALLMIATSGVGRWAGLDAFLFRKRRLGVN